MKMHSNQKFSRLDSADSYFLTQQLESLDPTEYYELVPSRLGRRFLAPVDNVAPYDPVYKYAMTHLKGRSKKSGPKAKDAPTSVVTKTQVTQQVKTHEATFGWTVDEIKAAKAKGLNLDADLYKAAVVSIEQDIDDTLAFGDPDTSDITGLLNHASIDDTITPITKTGGGTSWLGDAVLPDEIIGDVRKMLSAVRSRLKQATMPGVQLPMFQQWTMITPQDHLTKLASTPRSVHSDTSILEWLLTNLKRWIVAIEDWWQIDTAHGVTFTNGKPNHDGTPEILLMPALPSGACNPFAGGGLLPLDFETLNPQESGRNITIPAAGKCGGFVGRYPVAFQYLHSI